MSVSLVYLESLTGQCKLYAETYLKYGIEIIKSPQFSHSMSIVFIGMVLIMLIQTCDSKGGISLAKSTKIPKVEIAKDSFNTPPAKQSGRHMNRPVSQHLAPRSNALLADRNHAPGTPFSTVSTLTPDSNYKSINFKTEYSDDEAHSDDVSCAPSEGTTMSGFSRIDFLLYENEIMKSSVHDPKVLIGWRIFVKGRGNGVVLSTKKIKFSSTKFQIQFENGTIEYLSLKRSPTKGKIPFQLVSNGSVSA